MSGLSPCPLFLRFGFIELLDYSDIVVFSCFSFNSVSRKSFHFYSQCFTWVVLLRCFVSLTKQHYRKTVSSREYNNRIIELLKLKSKSVIYNTLENISHSSCSSWHLTQNDFVGMCYSRVVFDTHDLMLQKCYSILGFISCRISKNLFKKLKI